NHINNFELDELPVPLDKNFIVTLNKLSDEEEINNYVNDYFSIDIDYNIEPLNNDIQSNYIDDLKELNINIDKESATQFLFNPNLLNLISENYDDETQELVKYITEKHIQILNNRLLNNHQYSLSELDKEIISQVPIDGNWTDLSQETINKSK